MKKYNCRNCHYYDEMKKYNCRNCHYYDKDRAWCNYYKDEVPVILDNSCHVWAKK